MFYISMYDVRKEYAIVTCPACLVEIVVGRDEIDLNNWVCHCAKCGAVFGVVDDTRFHRWVANKWHNGDPTGPLHYCDFFVFRRLAPESGDRTISRFHGWVDPNTRGVVQIG